eukprot:XP_014004420.1 PREDICTED: Fanconi anemia group A protein homolog [Salmo salar]
MTCSPVCWILWIASRPCSLVKQQLNDVGSDIQGRGAAVSTAEIGLYEDVAGTGALVQPQCQAGQDVDKPVSLFDNTGRISATVIMEAW